MAEYSKALSLVLLCAACTVDEVSEAGKDCPCSEPDFVCACGTTCVPAGSTPPCDAGPEMNECEGSVVINDFRIEWATPNMISVAWDPESEDARPVVSYTLRATPVEEGADEVHVYSRAESQELGLYYRSQEININEVQRTFATDLAPDVEYTLELTATDGADNTCTRRIDWTTPLVPSPESLVIYSDEPPGGYQLPGCFSLNSTPPHLAGTAHYSYRTLCGYSIDCVDPENDPDGNCIADAVCDDGVEEFETCVVNVRFADLEVEFGDFTGDFFSSFVEFGIRSEAPAFYGNVTLVIGDADDGSGDRVFGFEPFTIPMRDAYTIVQIPLAEFSLRSSTEESRSIAPEDVNGAFLRQFLVGSSEFANGVTLDVDEVRIRWQ